MSTVRIIRKRQMFPRNSSLVSGLRSLSIKVKGRAPDLDRLRIVRQICITVRMTPRIKNEKMTGEYAIRNKRRMPPNAIKMEMPKEEAKAKPVFAFW